MAEVSENREILVVQGRELRPTFEATLVAGGYRFSSVPAASTPWRIWPKATARA